MKKRGWKIFFNDQSKNDKFSRREIAEAVSKCREKVNNII